MCIIELNKTFSPITILPVVGRTSPARQSSSVDFPAPEGPNNIVIPGGASKETSRTKAPASRRSFRMLATSVPELTLLTIASTPAPTRGD